MKKPLTRAQRHLEQKTCRHFTGIQNEHCKAQVRYDDFKCEPGKIQLPCLCLVADVPQHHCEHFAPRTEEEIQTEENEWQEALKRMRLVIAVVSEWRKKPPRGKQEIIECPACKGKLHLSQAASNGHVWGRCETKGCVSWME